MRGSRRKWKLLRMVQREMAFLHVVAEALESVPFLVFCVWMLDRASGSRPDSRRRLTLALMAVGGALAIDLRFGLYVVAWACCRLAWALSREDVEVSSVACETACRATRST